MRNYTLVILAAFSITTHASELTLEERITQDFANKQLESLSHPKLLHQKIMDDIDQANRNSWSSIKFDGIDKQYSVTRTTTETIYIPKPRNGSTVSTDLGLSPGWARIR